MLGLDKNMILNFQTQSKPNADKMLKKTLLNLSKILTKIYIKISIYQLKKLYIILIIQSSLGFTLASDRFDDEEDSFINLINSQTIDIGLNQSLDITQEPFYGFDPDTKTLFAKNVPKSISRFDIYEVVRKLKGFKNITVSEPVKKNNFSRYCWVEFSD